MHRKFKLAALVERQIQLENRVAFPLGALCFLKTRLHCAASTPLLASIITTPRKRVMKRRINCFRCSSWARLCWSGWSGSRRTETSQSGRLCFDWPQAGERQATSKMNKIRKKSIDNDDDFCQWNYLMMIMQGCLVNAWAINHDGWAAAQSARGWAPLENLVCF